MSGLDPFEVQFARGVPENFKNLGELLRYLCECAEQKHERIPNSATLMAHSVPARRRLPQPDIESWLADDVVGHYDGHSIPA